MLKRVLLSLLVVGLLGTVTAKRVYAVFVTESVHTSSIATSGTFTMSVKIGANSPCQSWVGTYTPGTPATANANTCAGATGTLFANTPRYPGDQTTVNVQVANAGTIPSQDLKVQVTGCTGVACTSPHAGGLEFYIQETNSTGVPLTNGCLYPDSVITDLPGVGTQYPVCNGVYWEPESFSGFVGYSCWDLGAVAAATTRYFTLGLQFPPDSDNSYQGTAATFAMKWHMDSSDGSVNNANCVNDP